MGNNVERLPYEASDCVLGYPRKDGCRDALCTVDGGDQCPVSDPYGGGTMDVEEYHLGLIAIPLPCVQQCFHTSIAEY